VSLPALFPYFIREFLVVGVVVFGLWYPGVVSFWLTEGGVFYFGVGSQTKKVVRQIKYCSSGNDLCVAMYILGAENVKRVFFHDNSKGKLSPYSFMTTNRSRPPGILWGKLVCSTMNIIN